MVLSRPFLAAVALCLLSWTAQAQQKFITVASTTSTEQSGLFKHLLPLFEKKSGIQVRVVAQGTGQALDMGKRGDADVVFVHDAIVYMTTAEDLSAAIARGHTGDQLGHLFTHRDDVGAVADESALRDQRGLGHDTVPSPSSLRTWRS